MKKVTPKEEGGGLSRENFPQEENEKEILSEGYEKDDIKRGERSKGRKYRDLDQSWRF